MPLWSTVFNTSPCFVSCPPDTPGGRRQSFQKRREKSPIPIPGQGVLLPAAGIRDGLRRRGIKLAIGSSSKNAGPILRAIGLEKTFEAVADGTHISRSKPDPEVFSLAGERLGVAPEACLVVEDANAGVEAGLAAGMKVLAVGFAAGHPGATMSATDLAAITIDEVLQAESVAR